MTLVELLEILASVLLVEVIILAILCALYVIVISIAEIKKEKWRMKKYETKNIQKHK